MRQRGVSVDVVRKKTRFRWTVLYFAPFPRLQPKQRVRRFSSVFCPPFDQGNDVVNVKFNLKVFGGQTFRKSDSESGRERAPGIAMPDQATEKPSVPTLLFVRSAPGLRASSTSEADDWRASLINATKAPSAAANLPTDLRRLLSPRVTEGGSTPQSWVGVRNASKARQYSRNILHRSSACLQGQAPNQRFSICYASFRIYLMDIAIVVTNAFSSSSNSRRLICLRHPVSDGFEKYIARNLFLVAAQVFRVFRRGTTPRPTNQIPRGLAWMPATRPGMTRVG